MPLQHLLPAIRCAARRGGAAAIVAALLVTTSLTPPAASAAQAPNAKGLSGATCVRTGSATITPGLTMTAQDFTFVETLTTGPCTGSGGSVPTATLTGRGKGHGSCTRADVTNVFTVAWSDGTSSEGHAKGIALPPFALVTGELTKGHFAGTPFQTSAVIVPDNPALCFSTGVTRVALYGEIGFA